jgi:di/tricarboxylate transporter
VDSTFWAGIAIGGLLSVLASVIAYVAIEFWFRHTVERARVRISKKRLEREVREYNRIKHFRKNPSVAVSYFALYSLFALSFLILSATSGLLAVGFAWIYERNTPELANASISWSALQNTKLPLLLTLMSYICVASFMRFFLLVLRSALRVRHFDSYERDLTAKISAQQPAPPSPIGPC